MIMPMRLGERQPVYGLSEGQGGFMGLLDGLAHVGREPWCSRGPCMALVAEIFEWAVTRTGTIDGLEWTGVGLHALQSWKVRTSIGYCGGYRPSRCGGPRVPGGPLLTASQTTFEHCPGYLYKYIYKFYKTISVSLNSFIDNK